MRKTHTEIHLRNEPKHGHKEYKYLYQQMLKDDVIRKAYKKLRKGKTKRKEIQYIDAHLDNEVQKMYDMILTQSRREWTSHTRNWHTSQRKEPRRSSSNMGKDEKFICRKFMNNGCTTSSFWY